MKEYISNSVKDTYAIAKDVLKKLSTGDIVLLCGDLGAGKTNFVKGIVSALNGNDNEVTSPTFTLVNEYFAGGKKIYHFDLYRIEKQEELYNIGIEEYLYSDAICFIEWPERAQSLFSRAKVVSITKLDENQRKITFKEC